MNIHRICTSCLTLIACSVVSLSQHTEKSLIADFHFCATVSASGSKREACLPSVLASRSARFATVLFNVKHLTGSGFGSSGCSFLFFYCTFLGSPFILLLLIHFVHCFTSEVHTSITGQYFPCLMQNHRRCGDEVQRVHLAVGKPSMPVANIPMTGWQYLLRRWL